MPDANALGNALNQQLTTYFKKVTTEKLPKIKKGLGGGETLPGFNEKNLLS